jgi:hypothetical protein
LARGFGKDPREAFAIDRLRFKLRAEDPNVAPPKNHCELYFKDAALWKIDGGTGQTSPIGGLGVSASPGFTWGKSGNVNTNQYLDNDGVQSNRTGRLVVFDSPVIRQVLVANENANTFDITIQEHDGAVFTDLVTISLSAQRNKSESFSMPITTGKELAVKVSSGSCKNPVVGVILDGVF